MMQSWRQTSVKTKVTSNIFGIREFACTVLEKYGLIHPNIFCMKEKYNKRQESNHILIFYFICALTNSIALKTLLVRFLFLIFLHLGIALDTAAQKHSYFVLTMKGSVRSENMGREFQTGDIISTDDELTFKGDQDMVGMIRSDGKRFVLKNTKEKKGTKLKWAAARALGKTRIEWKNLTLNTMEDLQDYFCEHPYIFLDSIAKIRINQKTYPQNGAQFFYFHFMWKGPNGEEEVNKKLDFKKDTLILKQATIFKVDKKPIVRQDVRDYKLMYYNRGESVKVGPFDVVFPDQEKMKTEIKILVDILKRNNSPAKNIHSECEAYIRQFYGSIDKINLTHWLNVHFGVPMK